jgi:UDP-GlcNAc:undecaprenyl-phosphate GlcNAc-1-phosphate transferase
VQEHLLPWFIATSSITVLWMVGITNAFNLLDNMDGLSGGIGAIAAAFFLLLAAASGQYLVGALAAACWAPASVPGLQRSTPPASLWATPAASFWGLLWQPWASSCVFPTNVTFVTWDDPDHGARPAHHGIRPGDDFSATPQASIP